jgi:hypothetical protein
MEMSIRELEILNKYFLELNLKIQVPGKNVQATGRPVFVYPWVIPSYICFPISFMSSGCLFPVVIN